MTLLQAHSQSSWGETDPTLFSVGLLITGPYLIIDSGKKEGRPRPPWGIWLTANKHSLSTLSSAHGRFKLAGKLAFSRGLLMTQSQTQSLRHIFGLHIWDEQQRLFNWSRHGTELLCNASPLPSVQGKLWGRLSLCLSRGRALCGPLL